MATQEKGQENLMPSPVQRDKLYWGYRKVDGKFCVCAYFDRDTMGRRVMDEDVIEWTGPFRADSLTLATEIVRDELAIYE